MTTVTLTRTQSAYTQKGSTTKKSGANPSTMPLSNSASKAVFIYLGFGIPAEALGPSAMIASAKLVMWNSAAWSGTHDLYARRNTSAWSASTITWATAAAGNPTTVAAYAVESFTNPPIKSRWEFDVLPFLQLMQAEGGKNFGFQIRTATVSGTFKMLNSGVNTPVLILEYYVAPAKPTSLSPANGQVVSVPQPVLRINAVTTGGTVQNALQVQVDAAHDGVTPDWDSGTVVTTSSQLDLSTIGGAPTLVDDGPQKSWRVRVRGTGDIWGAWSDWADFSYKSLGTLAVIEPPAYPDNVITDPTPPVTWELTGRTQQAYRLMFSDPSRPPGQDMVWDSGVVTSTAETATPSQPVATITGHMYRMTIRVWDTEPRVINGGATDFVETTQHFFFILTAEVNPVTNFVVEDLSPLPFVKLSFTRAEPPDGIQIVRDGVAIAVFDAAELHVSGDDYEWVDLTAAPRREHTWIVRAIVNGETSSVNLPQTLEIEPSGLWLSQPDKDRYMPFITEASQAVGLSEDGGTFQLLNGQFAVRVFGTQRGWSGTIVGEILATQLTGDQSGALLRDLYLQMRQDRGAPMILTLLDMNIKIVPFNMTIAPTPTLGRNGDYVYAASLEFIEVE